MTEEFQDKFIAFIDIVGFKHIVGLAELGIAYSLADILELKADLKWESNYLNVKDSSMPPPTCPYSECFSIDLDFQVTQISDCVVVSAEPSPAGIINLITHCYGIGIRLLKKGLLVRGYVTRGSIWHSEYDFVGSGYQNAFYMEDKVTVLQRHDYNKAPPFIEINKAVVDYIHDNCDETILKVFKDCTEFDGEKYAVFPFKVFQKFGSLDPIEHQRIGAEVKELISDLKGKVAHKVTGASEDAAKKASHYLEALENEMGLWDQNDAMFRKLMNTPFPS